MNIETERLNFLDGGLGKGGGWYSQYKHKIRVIGILDCPINRYFILGVFNLPQKTSEAI